MNLEAGTVIDRFTVLGLLGQGGMAAVYKVRHNQLGTLYALKVLTITSDSIKRRLMREGRVQAKLRHPNIVAVHDILDTGGVLGLVMDFVAGPTLDHLLQRHRLDVSQAITVITGVIAAVSAANERGVVHRDLKPANILLDVRPEGLVPMVTDFGLAKVVSDTGGGMVRTRSGTTMGTPSYMAPEQIRDAKNVDETADVFSLGAILYELVCGRLAFPGGDLMEIFTAIDEGRYVGPRDLVPALPSHVEAAIVGALETDRSRRIRDCATLWATLSPGCPIPARPPALQVPWELDDTPDDGVESEDGADTWGTPAATPVRTELPGGAAEKKSPSPTLVGPAGDVPSLDSSDIQSLDSKDVQSIDSKDVVSLHSSDVVSLDSSDVVSHDSFAGSEGPTAVRPMPGSLVDTAEGLPVPDVASLAPAVSGREPPPGASVRRPAMVLLAIGAPTAMALAALVALVALAAVWVGMHPSEAARPEVTEVPGTAAVAVPASGERPTEAIEASEEPAANGAGTSGAGTNGAGTSGSSGDAVVVARPRPVEMTGSCGSTASLEAAATTGRLTMADRACLESRARDANLKLTEQRAAGRVLLVNDKAMCDATRACREFEETQRFFFEELDRSDADMLFGWTRYLYERRTRSDVDREEVIMWADRALEQKQVWKSAEHVERVDALLEMRAVLAYEAWEARANAGVATGDTANRMRLRARRYSVEYLDYRIRLNRDDKRARQLCESASESAETCGQITRDAATTAVVTLSSIPEGAVVFVDDAEVGTTPLAHELSHGDHVVRMEGGGHRGDRAIVVGRNEPSWYTWVPADGTWKSGY